MARYGRLITIIKVLVSIVVGGLIISYCVGQGVSAAQPSADKECKDVDVIYARGSGDHVAGNISDTLRVELENNLQKYGLTVNFYELGSEIYNGHNYEAVGVGVAHPLNSLGAEFAWGSLIGSKYRDSVSEGVLELRSYMNERLLNCPSTKFVLSGFSQGAQVIGDFTTSWMTTEQDFKTAYVALFGDPKLNLEDGYPDILRCYGFGRNSWKRGDVSCKVRQGILDAREPYLSLHTSAVAGSWCEKNDGICTNSLFKEIFGLSSHGEETYLDKGYVKQAVDEASRAVRGSFKISIPEYWKPPIYAIVSTPAATPAFLTESNSTVSKLAKTTALGSVQSLPMSLSDDAVTIVPSTSEYYAKPGEEITFDVSRSFNDDEVPFARLEWDFDGDGIVDKYTAEPTTTYVYSSEFEGIATVVGRTINGKTGSAEFTVHIGENALVDNTPAVPANVRITQSNVTTDKKDVTISWGAADRALGYAIYVDGIPSGYLTGGELTTTLRDMPNDAMHTMGVASMNESATSAIGSVDVPVATPPAPEPPQPPVKDSLACKVIKLLKPLLPKAAYNLLLKLAGCS